MQVKFTNIGAPKLAADSRTFTFVFSDSGVDLQGDTLDASGWDTINFEANPIVLAFHDATLPIGKASNLRVQDDRLIGDIQFAETPLAEEIFQLVKGGFVKAVSVGFMPIEYKYSDDPDRPGGISYSKQSLLEVSLVSIPANPRALIEANAKGIATDHLQTWMIDRLQDKTLSPSARAVFKSLVNKEVEEFEKNEEELTLMAMTKIVKQARAEIRRLNSQIKALHRKAAEDGDAADEQEVDDPEVHLDKALAHLKAADELHDSAVDHMEEAQKCFRKCMKSMDGDGDDDDGDESDEDKDEPDDDIKTIKARALARMSR